MRGILALVMTSCLAWHGFSCTLPIGWEVTAFRLDPKRSQFRFHRRLVEVGTLNLVGMNTPPNLTGLVGELFARQEITPTVTPTIFQLGRWAIAHGLPGTSWIALTWDAQECRALHWSFPTWSAEPQLQLPSADETAARADWQVPLDSLATGPGDVRAWELFGARAVLPRSYMPTEVDAQPAAVRIDFSASGWADISTRRYGMASVLLDQRPLEAWLKRSLLSSGARIDTIKETSRGGAAAVHATFSVRGERPFDRVAWRRWPGEAWWWHDGSTNRILGLEQVGPERATRVELAHAY